MDLLEPLSSSKALSFGSSESMASGKGILLVNLAAVGNFVVQCHRLRRVDTETRTEGSFTLIIASLRLTIWLGIISKKGISEGPALPSWDVA